MPDFNNLSDLFKHVNVQIQSVLANEVLQEVIEIERYWIGKVVYRAYEPTSYKRKMYNGGLLDEQNFEHHFVNPYMVAIRSHRLDEKDRGRDVSAIVEYGHEKAMATLGYGYKYHADDTAEYLKPRPFTDEARKDIKQHGYHVDAMKRGLEIRGISYR